ncbi:MAG TPA: hypothetical protein EYP85_04295 [Armatimonadetes bacterium]|nr:hypothetical protein [Armatimonadota bacterium]
MEAISWLGLLAAMLGFILLFGVTIFHWESIPERIMGLPTSYLIGGLLGFWFITIVLRTREYSRRLMERSPQVFCLRCRWEGDLASWEAQETCPNCGYQHYRYVNPEDRKHEPPPKPPAASGGRESRPESKPRR